MGSAVREDVYCTLCLTESYLPGAAVLAKSLQDAGSKKKLACMIIPSRLSDSVAIELQSLFDYIIPVQAIGNPYPSNLYLMGRPDLQYTFTKIQLWQQTQFRKIVYVDSDVVALRAPDELFDLPDDFAAAPDVGWPDAFNSGVMVLSPNMGDYTALSTMASAGDSFDGADQGLLNHYFENRPWKRLSFTYNCTPSGHYQYEPAYRHYKRDISMVHFIGAEKPWQRGRSADGTPGSFQELLSSWWAVFDRHFEVLTHEYVHDRQELPFRSVRLKTIAKTSNAEMLGAVKPEALERSAEMPLTDPMELERNVAQGSVQAPQFSAPQIEWDATRFAPPLESKPEAANFPTQIYEFNTNPAPFRPPRSYPQLSRETQNKNQSTSHRENEGISPIFPWEERKRPVATRVFVEDEAPAAAQTQTQSNFHVPDELEVSARETVEPTTPKIKLNDDSMWNSFGKINKNAWDEMSGIDSYVRALTSHQRNRGKLQVLHDHSGAEIPLASPSEQLQVQSPIKEVEADELIEKVQKRRESLILTDFPTAVERPSLPVTPAPVRRTLFWGDDKTDDSQMPPAEGVPDQADWDPNVQLEQLRRNSLLDSDDLKLPLRKAIPRREMPSSAILRDVPEDAVIFKDSTNESVDARAVVVGPLGDAATSHDIDMNLTEGSLTKPGDVFKEESELSTLETQSWGSSAGSRANMDETRSAMVNVVPEHDMDASTASAESSGGIVNPSSLDMITKEILATDEFSDGAMINSLEQAGAETEETYNFDAAHGSDMASTEGNSKTFNLSEESTNLLVTSAESSSSAVTSNEFDPVTKGSTARGFGLFRTYGLNDNENDDNTGNG